MIWFAALKPKTYRYLRQDKNGNKKLKGTKKSNSKKGLIWMVLEIITMNSLKKQ